MVLRRPRRRPPKAPRPSFFHLPKIPQSAPNVDPDAVSRITPLDLPVRWNRALDLELCLGTTPSAQARVGLSPFRLAHSQEFAMHQLIYIVGLIVVILAILSFFGLR